MKREDLKALGIEKEAIDGIMSLHQKDVEVNNQIIKDKDVELTAKDTQLTELNSKIKEFDGIDVSKLQNDVTSLQTKYTEDLAKERKNNAIKLEVVKAKPLNEKAMIALLDMDAVTIKEDGTVLGLKEQIEAVKIENAFLFAEHTTAVNLGGNHGGTPPPKEPDSLFGALELEFNQK